MLILASQSPRRSELLRAAGLDFVVRPVDIDESVHPGEAPDRYVVRVAQKKALASSLADGDIVLAADTTVAVGTEILLKPRDAADARDMLEKLSGRCHEVYTGVCLRTSGCVITESACTRVWFAPLSAAEIDEYVRSNEPMDKAGAYAIQGLASRYIQRIDGSYSNVVGLPVELVCRMLKQL